jgi:hypothetical protein
LLKYSNDYSKRINQINEKFENAVNNKIGTFTDVTIKTISDFIGLQLESLVPTKDIRKLVLNKESSLVLDKIKDLLVFENTKSDPKVKELINQSKDVIIELSSKLKDKDKVIKEATEINENLAKSNLIKEKVSNLPALKRQFIQNAFKDKSVKYITEQFDYISSLYDKRERDSIKQEKKITKPITKHKDNNKLIVTESVKSENQVTAPTKRTSNNLTSEIDSYFG